LTQYVQAFESLLPIIRASNLEKVNRRRLTVRDHTEQRNNLLVTGLVVIGPMMGFTEALIRLISPDPAFILADNRLTENAG
jgi:hypothetical protein